MEMLNLLSTNEVVAQIISFLLLFFLLRALAWKKILTLLDERRERIAAEFRQIEAIKADLAKVNVDYEARVAALDEVTAKKILEAAIAARKEGDVIRKKAHSEAERIIKNGRESAQYELSKTKELLREEIVGLVIKTAGDIIGEKLTSGHDRKMIEDFLREIDKAQ
jgi:F-type H+-transporting ATPase subunit b